MMNSSRPILSVSGLNITFTDENGSLTALNDLNFSVTREEFVCILGPSGSGKSALLKVLAGLLKPSEGAVTYMTNNPSRPKPRIGFVFQQANLMPWRTVLANISLPLEMMNIKKETARAKAMEWVKLIGLEGFENVYPSKLSGGMAQRVALARAMIQDPDILLLDEPFGALDAITRERMGLELLNLWQIQHITVIMVTHSISEALFLSDRVLVMSNRPGQICLDLKDDLPRPRHDEMRYLPHFSELSSKLRSAIE